MEEEKQTNVTGEGVVDNTDYIAAIKELKENSVDRSKYDALKAENKKLLDSIVNGTEIAQQQSEEKIATANKVADVLQQCVDYAEGDSAVFTNELQRRIVDVKIR